MATILFENNDYVGIDKPEGLSCIPERDRSAPSLVRSLEEERGCKLYVVHRLDKEASGVIVYAKTADAHRHLNDLFATRKVEKRYLLLVHGVIAADSATIDKPIREFGSGRMGIDERRGKPSVTEYSVVKRLPAATLLEAAPHTGRRHQLRVHFYSEGHPVVGDVRYGDKALQSQFGRLMLHAMRVAFDGPGGERITVEAPVPVSFEAIVRDAGSLERTDSRSSTQ